MAGDAPLKKNETVEQNLSKVRQAPTPATVGESVQSMATKAKDQAEATYTSTKTPALEKAELAKAKAIELKSKAVTAAKDPAVQVTVVTAAGGATVGGISSAIGGAVLGGAVGIAAGIVPAIFTFGLSIPAGCIVGAGCGSVIGGAAGSTAGALGAGAAGYGTYTKRKEIVAFTKKVKARAISAAGAAKAKGKKSLDDAKAQAASLGKYVEEKRAEGHKKVVAAIAKAKSEALKGTAKAKELALDRTCQVTAASAAAGATTLGLGGAATGLVAGGTLGAAVGVIPAIFTFGLSIPVFAVIGGTCGTAVGTATGASAGFVSGGAAGYGAYTRREKIASTMSEAKTKADAAAKYVRDTASESALRVRSRLAGGTGGTN